MALGGVTDGFVQVAPDGAGKKIDNAELTRDDGTVVERQRIVLADDENPRAQVGVTGEAGDAKLEITGEHLKELHEINQTLRAILTLLCMELQAHPTDIINLSNSD